jgi:hypothetical protein
LGELVVSDQFSVPGSKFKKEGVTEGKQERAGLLKVDDSVSFRAINKIIRFTVLPDKQFTSSRCGVSKRPLYIKTLPSS